MRGLRIHLQFYGVFSSVKLMSCHFFPLFIESDSGYCASLVANDIIPGYYICHILFTAVLFHAKALSVHHQFCFGCVGENIYLLF